VAFLKQVRSWNEQTRRQRALNLQIARTINSFDVEDLAIAQRVSQVQAYLASLIAKKKPLRIISIELLHFLGNDVGG